MTAQRFWSPLAEEVLGGGRHDLRVLAAAGHLPLSPNEILAVQVALAQVEDSEIAEAAQRSVQETSADRIGTFISEDRWSPRPDGTRVTVVRRLSSDELTPREVASLRALFDDSWPDPEDAFAHEDLLHAMGGVHFVVETDGAIVSHASVVERELHTGGHRLATGYVEAVATLPEHRRRGYANAIMQEVGRHIDRTFPIGALGTGLHAFYGRLGWTTWKGPTSVRTERGLERTPDEDGFVLVRLTPTSPDLDLAEPISCEWRPGDVW